MAERSTPLLGGLTAAQREAVTIEAAPLCLLAGAGSGKTRVLTRRIAWRVSTGAADGAHVIALTFSRKAAGELRARLAELGVRDQVAAGTFHGLAYAQLRRRWADHGVPAPTLLDRKAGLLSRLLRDRGERGGGGGGAAAGDVAAEIEWAKARLIPPEGYTRAARLARRRVGLALEEVAELYERYEATKRRRGLVDFDDLLVRCAEALERDSEFAAGQRWRFRHFFVDEFQDANPAQFRLLQAWVGGRPDLCVVGDPNQAIYSWNGADPALLTEFAERFPGTTVVRLDDNFRSSPQILAVANAVLGQARSGWAPDDDRPPAGRAHLPDGAVPTVRSFATDAAEAAGVAQAVRRVRRPNTIWSRIAVLARTNAQLRVLSSAFRAAAIPCRVTGDRDLLARPDVRAVLDQLPRAPAGMAFLDRFADLVAGGAATPDTAAVGPARGVAAGMAAGIGADSAGTTVLRLAREFADLDSAPTLDGFLAWLQVTSGSDSPATGDAVELTTFHRAKGLEWPVVYLVGLEQGLVPIGHATTAAAEAEERRLLYVAMTRAQSELHCSWAERRSFSGRMVESSTSSRSPAGPWSTARWPTAPPCGACSPTSATASVGPGSGRPRPAARVCVRPRQSRSGPIRPCSPTSRRGEPARPGHRACPPT